MLNILHQSSDKILLRIIWYLSQAAKRNHVGLAVGIYGLQRKLIRHARILDTEPDLLLTSDNGTLNRPTTK